MLEEANYASSSKDYSKAIEAYETALNKMSETLVRSLTKYDPVMLYCAVILAVQVILVCLFTFVVNYFCYFYKNIGNQVFSLKIENIVYFFSKYLSMINIYFILPYSLVSWLELNVARKLVFCLLYC